MAMHPPMYAARLALSPPSGPCALLRPNSMTSSPAAAWQILAALVATSVWKFIRLRRAVSTSWHWMSGPLTLRRGSFGNARFPSGMASTLRLQLMFFR